MNVIEALRSRRSVGRLDGDVDEADLAELIELAAWAPNHRLTEPWRFTILRGAARARLGATWAGIVARSSALEGREREELLEGIAAKTLRAPIIVAVSTRTVDDPVVAIEDFAATAAAVQNLLLAAHDKGFGAMWRTGGMAYDPEIKAFLGLDPTDRIVAFVYLGRVAVEPPKARPRDPAAATRRLT